jgi:hypothetical protein
MSIAVQNSEGDCFMAASMTCSYNLREDSLFRRRKGLQVQKQAAGATLFRANDLLAGPEPACLHKRIAGIRQ